MQAEIALNGFTPAADELVQLYGPTTAMVFGAIWRYCQMEDGVCRASESKIAARAGVSVSTLGRHTEVLVRDGYLEDTTPDRRNSPHIYRDTGKIKMRIVLSAGQNADYNAAIPSPNLVGQNDKPVRQNGVPLRQNDVPRYVKMTDEDTVTKIHKKKEKRREEEDTQSGANAQPSGTLSPQQEYFRAVCCCVGWFDSTTLTESQRGQVAQTMGILKTAGITIDHLRTYYQDWRRSWRSKGGREYPTLNTLRAEIMRVKVPDKADQVMAETSDRSPNGAIPVNGAGGLSAAQRWELFQKDHPNWRSEYPKAMWPSIVPKEVWEAWTADQRSGVH